MKKPTASQTHFGLTNIGSNRHCFSTTSIRNHKFSNKTPCIWFQFFQISATFQTKHPVVFKKLETVRPQCGNSMIFLSLRFYVKYSDFGHSRSTKSAVLIQLEALNFDSYAFLPFLKDGICQMNNIQSS